MSISVVNRVIVCGAEQEKINEVFDFFKGVNGDMDFNKIIPMPKELIHMDSNLRDREALMYYMAIAHGDYKEIDFRIRNSINKELKTRKQHLAFLENKYSGARI